MFPIYPPPFSYTYKNSRRQGGYFYLSGFQQTVLLNLRSNNNFYHTDDPGYENMLPSCKINKEVIICCELPCNINFTKRY